MPFVAITWCDRAGLDTCARSPSICESVCRAPFSGACKPAIPREPSGIGTNVGSLASDSYHRRPGRRVNAHRVLAGDLRPAKGFVCTIDQ